MKFKVKPGLVGECAKMVREATSRLPNVTVIQTIRGNHDLQRNKRRGYLKEQEPSPLTSIFLSRTELQMQPYHTESCSSLFVFRTLLSRWMVSPTESVLGALKGWAGHWSVVWVVVCNDPSGIRGYPGQYSGHPSSPIFSHLLTAFIQSNQVIPDLSVIFLPLYEDAGFPHL